jgi:hypothetical protein
MPARPGGPAPDPFLDERPRRFSQIEIVRIRWRIAKGCRPLLVDRRTSALCAFRLSRTTTSSRRRRAGADDERHDKDRFGYSRHFIHNVTAHVVSDGVNHRQDCRPSSSVSARHILLRDAGRPIAILSPAPWSKTSRCGSIAGLTSRTPRASPPRRGGRFQWTTIFFERAPPPCIVRRDLVAVVSTLRGTRQLYSQHSSATVASGASSTTDHGIQHRHVVSDRQRAPFARAATDLSRACASHRCRVR